MNSTAEVTANSGIGTGPGGGGGQSIVAMDITDILAFPYTSSKANINVKRTSKVQRKNIPLGGNGYPSLFRDKAIGM